MTALITTGLLAYCGTASPVSLAPVLDVVAARHGITTPARVQAWLANVLNESGMLTRVAEDMTYESAARLRAVFPSHFHTTAEAQRYVRDPIELGNFVYAKIGGYDFRGRGFAQLTGHPNYAAYAAVCGKPLSAVGAWMETPEGAADSAAWFFASRGCAEMADRGDLLGVRQAWAGSTYGLPIGWTKVERLHGLVAAGMGARPVLATRPVAVASAAQSVVANGTEELGPKVSYANGLTTKFAAEEITPSTDDTADLNAAELAGTLTEPEGA